MNPIFKFLGQVIKPAQVIKEIKAAPEGGKGNLYRPAVVKYIVKMVLTYGLLAFLAYLANKQGMLDQFLEMFADDIQTK